MIGRWNLFHVARIDDQCAFRILRSGRTIEDPECFAAELQP